MGGRGRGANPLAHVLQALDEPLDLLRYKTWNVVLPEGQFLTEASLVAGDLAGLVQAAAAGLQLCAVSAAAATAARSCPLPAACLPAHLILPACSPRSACLPACLPTSFCLTLPACLTLLQVGATQFCEVLQQVRGPEAVAEWQRLQVFMRPLADAAAMLPPVAFRQDAGAALTAVARYLPSLLSNGGSALKLTGPFSKVGASGCVFRGWT